MNEMINRLRNEVMSSANRLNIKCEVLDTLQREQLFKKLLSSFFSIDYYDFPFWNFVVNDFSVQNEDAWRWVEDYIGTNQVLLFFEQNDDKNFIRFSNGKDVVRVISESYLFTIYLTNDSVDYLLSFNRYDFIIATGKAKQWLIDYSSNFKKNKPHSNR